MEDDEIQIINASEISFCLDDIELSSLKPQREVNESTAMTTVSTLNSSFFDQIDLASLNRQEKIVNVKGRKCEDGKYYTSKEPEESNTWR